MTCLPLRTKIKVQVNSRFILKNLFTWKIETIKLRSNLMVNIENLQSTVSLRGYCQLWLSHICLSQQIYLKARMHLAFTGLPPSTNWINRNRPTVGYGTSFTVDMVRCLFSLLGWSSSQNSLVYWIKTTSNWQCGQTSQYLSTYSLTYWLRY